LALRFIFIRKGYGTADLWCSFGANDGFVQAALEIDSFLNLPALGYFAPARAQTEVRHFGAALDCEGIATMSSRVVRLDLSKFGPVFNEQKAR
jgi:hypothetical protein